MIPPTADAVTKAKQAMEAMEKSYLHASNLTAQHKKEMEKYAALNVSLNAMVAEAAKALAGSKTGMSSSAQSNKAKRSVMETSTTKSGYHDYQKRSGEKLTVSNSEKLLSSGKGSSQGTRCRGCPSKIKCTNLRKKCFPLES